MAKSLNRRDFLRCSGGLLGASVLAGCVAQQPIPVPIPAPATPAPEAVPTVSAPAVIKGATVHFLGYAMFVPKMNEVFQEIALEWATQNGVKFSWELATTSDIAARIATAIETKMGPTIFQYASPPASWAEGLMDITDLAEEIGSQQEGWYPTAPAVMTANNRWFAIPLGTNTPMINWREDWFKEVGFETFPDTWDEVLEAGKKLKAAGHPFGWVVSGAKAPFDGMACSYVLLWSFGGKEFNEDGTLALDSSETLDALDFAIKLHEEANDPGAIGYGDASNNNAFLAGQISMTLNVNTIYLPALTDAPDVAKAMNHALPPKGPAGRFNYQGYPCVSIPKYVEGRDRDAAIEFLRHFFSVPVFSKYIKEGKGYLIPQAPIYENLPIWDPDPKLKLAREIGRIARWAGYALPTPSKLSSLMASQFTISNMFNNAVTNRNPRAALDATLSEIEQLRSQ